MMSLVVNQVVGVVNITTMNNRQYCVIMDPVDGDGKPQLGKKKLVKGEKSFFLMPGERLEKGIQNVFVLGENEGLILRATESFKDEASVRCMLFLFSCVPCFLLLFFQNYRMIFFNIYMHKTN